MDDKNNIIETKNLSKLYHSKLVVKEVSMKVPKGQIYGLLGKNSCENGFESGCTDK